MFPLKDDIPSVTYPIVNISLIILNILVFIYELNTANINVFIMNHAFIPAVLFQYHDVYHSLIRAFESMFLHGGFLHIIGNMWFLWIFGDNVEDELGHTNYLFFYVAGGLFATLVQGIIAPASTIPLIGASGAISAVVGAYFVFFPQAKILSLVPIFIFITFLWIPSWLFIVFWFFMQYFNGILSISTSHLGGVAWFAHIGGFVFGFVTAKFMLYKHMEK
jgi:membrane associated rhomboid family serine protease